MSATLNRPRRTGHERRRTLSAALGWAACALALVLVIGPLLDIVYVVAARGLSAFSIGLFTTVTNGTGGGLLNAITGTIILSLGALVVAVPVGVGAGIYLSEYGTNRLGSGIRFLSDVLTGTPSIVLGYFSYIVFVTWLGWDFSVLAGSITLAILIVPYLARITELALRQVPNNMREAGFALGAREPTVVFKIVLPMAAPGDHRHPAGARDLGRRDGAAHLHRRLVQLSVERAPHQLADRLSHLRDLELHQRAL